MGKPNEASQENFLKHGSPEPLPERVSLRAGPLALFFEAGDLRHIRLGGREILRRIYAAVRDHNWGTVPPVMSALKIEAGEDSFQIRYSCTYRENEIHFVAQVEIQGHADGSLHFTFEGEAKSTFLRNRIGCCVLHPIHECAGARCRAIYIDGSQKELLFPKVIAAEQPVTGLDDLAGLSYEIEPGNWAELRFEGDAFATEDQRNWIDASFKTFSTPLRLPFPVELQAGTKVRQSVTLRLVLTGHPAPPQARSNHVALRVIRQAGLRLPELGLCVASHGESLRAREVERLVPLGLMHLRVEVRLDGKDWPERLRAAAKDALELGVALELAIHLPSKEPGDLAAVGKELRDLRTDLTRALIFRDGQMSTLAKDLERALIELGDCGMPIGAGTNADLYQLNLQRPPGDGAFIAWSMNPQVHAFDVSSIAETPEAAAQQVASVRAYYPGKPLVVSPVTLKPRFNPVASSATTVSAGILPPTVDARQMSLFGAGWTLAMLKALVDSGAESVTLFETTGWLGVMETEHGSPMPEKFPSVAGAVFPLYHVLADLGELVGGVVVQLEASDPLAVAAMALTRGPETRLWLANLSAEPRRVEVTAFPQCRRIRRLDAANVRHAMTNPEAFRAEWAGLETTWVELPAFGLAALANGNGPAK